jgi:hypothetical protein
LRHDSWTEVASAAVSRDGRHVVAVGRNGVVMGWRLAGSQLEPDATARLLRLLSCTAPGRDEVLPATADNLEAEWNELRRTHPAELRPAADLAAEWSFSQFNAALGARRFGPAGRYVEATWTTYPADDWNKLITGGCYLAAGDRAGVRRTFAELARITDADPTPMHRTRAVEIGLHDPEALTRPERARAIAFGDKLPRPGAERDAYLVLARALALTRAGRLDEAEREAALLQKANDKMVQARANGELAVICRLQGQAAEAKKLADAAAVELTRHESGGLTNEWISAILLRRLVDEARQPLPKPVP